MMDSRRRFLQATSAAALFANATLASAGEDSPASIVRVLIWDEQQPAQKEAYSDFLGNAIAAWLKTRPNIEVRSVRLDDPEQGLADGDLNWANVIVWWGHVRQAEITPETARKKIVEPILAGKLSLIALHSAHWSTPFMEAMNERTKQDAYKRYLGPDGPPISFEFTPPRGRMAPTADAPLTPRFIEIKNGEDVRRVTVMLPNCCFPAYRPDGAPSTMRVLKPDHPIVRGLPETFQIQHTEMYNEPFHVPEPDEVVLRETWSKGESFRSGCVWSLGRGKVFYFRPGHETFSVYLQREPLQIVENAVRWLAAGQH